MYYLRLSLYTLLFAFCFNNLKADDNLMTLQEKVDKMDTLLAEKYREKIYLQTDRPVYNLQDTVWYKALVLQSGSLQPTEKSRILYVDLINERNVIVQSSQCLIEGGTSCGRFVLPFTQNEKGTFRIRAYTRWMRNFNDTICSFEKRIPIWSDEKEKKEKKYIAIYNKSGDPLYLTQKQYQKYQERKKKNIEKELDRLELDVQFLPEGGKLVAGVPNRIAFKSLFPDGRGFNISGTIVDQDGLEHLSFASTHKGMGSFVLTPEKGKRYKAVLSTDQIVDLPPVEPEGIAMMALSKTGSDSLSVILSLTPNLVAQRSQFILLLESRGLLKEAFQIDADRPRIVMHLRTDSLSSGISRLVLFSIEGEPIGERLIYIQKDDRMSIDCKASWEIKSDSVQMMTLRVSPGLMNQKCQASLAVSVTNRNIVPVDSLQDNLLSKMFLSSDLKGYVEDPGYYFNRPYEEVAGQIDLLLLTHGWAGYNWSSDLKRSFNHLPDTAYNISGRITNLVGKGIKDKEISLFIQGGKVTADKTVSVENGSFIFSNLDIRGNSIARLKIEDNKKGLMGIGMQLDSTNTRPYYPLVPLNELYYENSKADSLMSLYKQQIDDDRRSLDSLKKKRGILVLDEIVITEKKTVKGSYNRSKLSDVLIDSAKIGQYDAYTNVIDILLGEIPGFEKSSRNTRGADGKIQYRQYDTYMINGKPVYFQVDAEIIAGNGSLTDATNSMIFSNTEDSELTTEGGMNAEDSEYGKNQLIDNILESIPGVEVKAIEVLTSRSNLANYNIETIGSDNSTKGVLPVLDQDKRPVASVVVITTKDGKGVRTRQPQGTYFLTMKGVSQSREFYVPKYYPTDVYEQTLYDQRPLVYWNPNVLTDGQQEIELTFPVGAYMKDNLQIEIEGSDLNGHIGRIQQVITPVQ